MALPKKGLRKIAVGNQRFAWSATGNDGFISLTIAQADANGQLLSTAFGYHSIVVEETQTEYGTVRHCKQQLVITPGIVRQVIEYALTHGWQPNEGGGQYRLLGIEDHIDLHLRNPAN